MNIDEDRWGGCPLGWDGGVLSLHDAAFRITAHALQSISIVWLQRYGGFPHFELPPTPFIPNRAKTPEPRRPVTSEMMILKEESYNVDST